MNVGEYGLVVNFNAQYDLSRNASLALQFVRADGSTFTVSSPQVSLGTASITTALGPFPANQYVKYTIANGDLSVPGIYTARLIYTDATKKLYSNPDRFQVLT